MKVIRFHAFPRTGSITPIFRSLEEQWSGVSCGDVVVVQHGKRSYLCVVSPAPVDGEYVDCSTCFFNKRYKNSANRPCMNFVGSGCHRSVPLEDQL